MSGWSQTYSFDGFGNLASKSVPAGSAEPAFPGANPDKNWLNGAVYDANGNTLGLNGLGFLYDTENRMSAFATGSFYENYVYDESDHRVERSNNAGGANADLVYFYGPGGKLMGTFQITLIGASPASYTATVKSERVYFGGMLLGQAGPDYSHDVSTVTDRLGTAVPGYPYGTDVGTAAGADQPDFATYTKEGGSGLEYANQRYYSAGYGRFMTVDPYGGSVHPGTPMSWNRYSYVLGDPVNASDSTGADSSCDGSPGDYSYGQDHCFMYAPSQGAPPVSDPNSGVQWAIDFPVVLPSIDDQFASPAPPPPPIQQLAPPMCDVSLFDESAIVSWDPFVHTYLRLSVFDPNTDLTQTGFLEAGPAVFNPKANWLFQVINGQSWVNKSFGTTPLYTNKSNSVYDFAQQYSSSQLCAAVTTLGKEYNSYRDNTSVYSGISGPNSNSFTSTFIQGADLSVPLFIGAALTLYAPGWGGWISQ